LRQLRASIRRRPLLGPIYRIAVAIVGSAIIIGGLLLVPLPGPGWLIVFLGLGILATEFRWASRLLGWSRYQLGRWSEWTRRRSRWVQTAMGLGVACIVVGIFAGYIAWRGAPGWVPGWVPGAGGGSQ